MESKTKCAAQWISGVEPPSELRALSMIEIYERECREQPACLSKLIKAYRDDASITAEMDHARRAAGTNGTVLFLGMGASYCSCIAGSLVLQTSGRESFAADAGEWLHYALPAWRQAACTILVTTSGESAELVALCKKRSDRVISLVCNNGKSKCWNAAQIRLPILAGPEYGNATKTYTNSTAACIVLAAHIAGMSWKKDAEQVLEIYPETLNSVFERRKELEAFCRDAANIEIVGRGGGYAGAIMGSLCIREMSGKRAAGHSGAGFHHGPILDVNGSHVAIISALGHTAELGVKLAQECNRRGGKVILVGTEDYPASEKLLPVKIAAVPEPWESLTSVLVPQALTLALIERSGANLKPRFEYGTMEE